MRRIPRPSRAIDPSAPLQSSVRHRVLPSPCSPAAAPCTHLRTCTAAFSTTSSNAFLLPGKQDKKKHQQFVRRWQKRLLGDSEPIGAHVDPYDPTSPVRIAPEEQGEYEEVLEEEGKKAGEYGESQYRYLPAEEMGVERPGSVLMRVGGERWLQQKLEGDMAKEFEKLTRQTYTPLSLEMANDIETLTGSPYTLRDDNLMMAQTVHDITNRPYTQYDFGLHGKANKPDDVRNRFTQAVAEVFALKEAGLDMDLAKLPNRGVYDTPRWVRQIKLYKTESGDLALAYPKYKSAEQFIQIMRSTPNWESSQPGEEAEVLVDEAAELLNLVLLQEPVPTMDPTTPAFKRAAVVKIDPEKKPFDFMSNRPVPRAKPVKAEKVEDTLVADESIVEPVVPAPAPSRLTELASAFEASRSAVNDLRHIVLEYRAQRLAYDIVALRKAARYGKSSSTAEVEEVKWRHVPITDINIKFALFKRLFQLTGIRISDPHLNTSDTLGDLYGHLCAAAKPQPKSLFSAIYIEGQKARERAKQQAVDQAARRHKADLGDLITLGNVELRRVKAKKVEKRTKIGQDKVIDYALWERGLHRTQSPPKPKDIVGHPLGLRLGVKKNVVEGTRVVPEFGKPLSSHEVNVLVKETKNALKLVEEGKLNA